MVVVRVFNGLKHLGLGTTGGQVADRPKSLGRKRLRKEIMGESRV